MTPDMTQLTDDLPTVSITVRFFAAAAAAAGRETQSLALPPGATVSDAVCELSGQSDKMALVLRKCSYLCDGVAVRNPGTVLHPGQTLDVLPPFAGG